VRIGGFDMGRDGDKARQLLSYVPDQPFLYEKLTGREFLQFIADMYGLEKRHGKQRIDEVIGLFQLGEFVDDLTERLLTRHAAANGLRGGRCCTSRRC